jgi:hypothetical protein
MDWKRILIGVVGGVIIGKGAILISSQVVVGEELKFNEPAIVSYLQLTNGKAIFPPKSQLSYIKVVNSYLQLDQDQVSYLEGENSKIEVVGGFIASGLLKGGEAHFKGSTISSLSVDLGGKVELKGGKIASLVLNRGVVKIDQVKFTSEGYSKLPSNHPQPGRIILYPSGKLIIKGSYTLNNNLLKIKYRGGGETAAYLTLLNGGEAKKLIETE